jgi:hypothetical protein
MENLMGFSGGRRAAPFGRAIWPRNGLIRPRLAGFEVIGDNVGKFGETSGGVDFLIARAGGGFTVPIRKAALAWLAKITGETA